MWPFVSLESLFRMNADRESYRILFVFDKNTSCHTERRSSFHCEQIHRRSSIEFVDIDVDRPTLLTVARRRILPYGFATDGFSFANADAHIASQFYLVGQDRIALLNKENEQNSENNDQNEQQTEHGRQMTQGDEIAASRTGFRLIIHVDIDDHANALRDDDHAGTVS